MASIAASGSILEERPSIESVRVNVSRFGDREMGEVFENLDSESFSARFVLALAFFLLTEFAMDPSPAAVSTLIALLLGVLQRAVSEWRRTLRS